MKESFPLLFPLALMLAGLSGCQTTVQKPFSGLTEGALLPTCKIYSTVNDQLIKAFSETSGWHLIVDEGGNADAVFKDGILRVNVHDGGRIWYAIQACFIPLALTEGKWEIVFDARSDEPREMTLDIGHVGGDWYTFSGRKVFPLSPEWKTYHLAFNVGIRLDQKARFEFNLGGKTVGAEFRDLKITRSPLP